MAELTRLFSLVITGLCLLTVDIFIYLHPLMGGPFRNYNIDVFFEDITLGEMWKHLSCKILPKLHIHIQINNCMSHTKGVVLQCSNSQQSSIVILS